MAQFTLIELIVTVTVISILVGMVMPLTRNVIKRQRETELRQALHEMRIAIDKYKDASDKGQIQQNLGTEGYPTKLQDLVDGVPVVNQVDKKLKFLRKIPTDPMTHSIGLGPEIVSGRCEGNVMGRPGRVRRAHAIRRNRIGWNQVHYLVGAVLR